MSQKITLIVPASNEAGANRPAIADIKSLPLPGSIVVGDNNSTDHTGLEAERWSRGAYRSVKGKGNAVSCASLLAVCCNHAFRDGVKIVWLIVRLLPREFPLRLYVPPATLNLFSIFLCSHLHRVFADRPGDPLPTRFWSLFGMLSAFDRLGPGLVLTESSNLKDENRYFSDLANRCWPVPLPTVAGARDGRSDGLRRFGSGRFCEDGWLRG
jgi:hypothetical protein